MDKTTKSNIIIVLVALVIVIAVLSWFCWTCLHHSKSFSEDDMEEKKHPLELDYLMDYNYSVISKDDVIDYINATDYYDRFLYETSDSITFTFINNENFDIKIYVGIDLPAEIYNRAAVGICPENEPDYKYELERCIGIFGRPQHSIIYLYPGIFKNITFEIYMPRTNIGSIRNNHTYEGKLRCYYSDITSYGSYQPYYFKEIPFKVRT